MSAVKRVRKQLDKSLKSGGSSQAARKNASLHSRIESLKRDVERGASSTSSANEEYGAVVTLMGTGKAIEKTLSIASWFEQQQDCHVSVKTRTVVTVDDIAPAGDNDNDVHDDSDSRLRRLSCLEVVVSLK